MERLQNVTFELSGKAFVDESEKTMTSVAEILFDQWRSLWKKADGISILLWISDGSEILDFSGDLEQKFEWAYWLGCANHKPVENPTEAQKRSPHCCRWKYRPDAAPRSYRWLKRVVEVLRKVGLAATGRKIRIGTAFDGGPEFALSDFKYRRHPEIVWENEFVFCDAVLHRDDRPYAFCPKGIPEGMRFGEFMGGQFRCYSQALALDYLWLSNGMGFGRETGGITGGLFDKHRFFPKNVRGMTKEMMRFWDALEANCPGIDIETRGSNYSAGVEIATDAAPLAELYRKKRITIPVNSPWAALDFKTGLEISAWMTHMADLPNDRIPFRFYAHDPWWMNSPWLDRYDRRPWDIDMPLSVTRLDHNGTAMPANRISIITVDDTRGNLSETAAREISDRILNAVEHAPDAPAPFVWVYPFHEYAAWMSREAEKLDIIFNEDIFLGETLQCGLPLNTVISTKNFRKLDHSDPEKLRNAILVVPVSAADAVHEFVERGGATLFYGSLIDAPRWLEEKLGLSAANPPLTGTVRIISELSGDHFDSGEPATAAHIFPQFNAGGLTERAVKDGGACVLCRAEANGESRVIASKKDRLVFLRSVPPCAPEISADRSLDIAGPDRIFPVERLALLLLEEFGWKVRCSAASIRSLLPRMTMFRHRNALCLTGFAPDSTVELRLATPLGAPVFTGDECRIAGDESVWTPGKSFRYECRAFVRQRMASVIGGKTIHPALFDIRGRRLYKGLEDAEIRFLPPTGMETTLEVVVHPSAYDFFDQGERVEPEWEDSVLGRCAVIRHVTGAIRFSW